MKTLTDMNKYLLLLLTVAIVSCSPVKKYESLPEVRAWEDEISLFEETDKSEDSPENSILFTGSSSIRLWKTLAEDMAPYPVIQRGFGGSKLQDFMVYTNRIVSPHTCSAIVIFIANDITGGNNDRSPEEVASMFSYMLKTIRKSHPDTPVFWISVTPTPSRWKAWPQISEAGSMISEICDRQKNTYYIRTDTAFLDKDGFPIKEYFVADMLHLNPAGYKLWNSIIKNEIKKIVPMPKVSIIAHRGASFDAPENTVAASKLAWSANADAVECDIHFTKDSKVIVSHDGTTRRTTGQSLTIRETSADELRKLDAGSYMSPGFKNEKLPFLEELIATVPAGKELVTEIKCGPEVLPELKRIISSSRKDITYTFIAFDFQTISETKKLFPSNSCYWLCSNKELLKKNISLVPASGIEGVSLSHGIINDEVVKQVKAMNKELFTWTVDDVDEAKRLMVLGVKGITTNRPGWLRERLGI
jgi:glycerophosphoryl diester phosphodiesterase